MLVVNEVDNRRPGVTVIDVVSEPGGVDDRKLDLELFLFKLGLDYLHLCQFVELLVMTPAVVL